MNAPLPPLTPTEARILGVLVEKEKTVPDTYPLTLNSLAAGCNQKTSRDPVMNLAESELQAALEELRGRALVIESYGASGRVLRYAQNFAKVYGLPQPSVALLTMLMLRGPQTVSELRANCERLYHFEDASTVEAYLEELAERGSGALAVKLPKQPGSREHRWAHLLCGEVSLPTAPDSTRASSGALEERVARLEEEVAELRATLAALIDKTPD
ncbi:YceH family protein [Propionivibrio sp.]|uniref:YceH family protein n=1 Tax=Propionivibrio sp. TaxID=2212460 RepID=UPI00272EA4E4|nr:YceH family protein [Propionivibrio sp.]